ncbi:hypothetical protein [Falsihalocynthiibacter arcticus]|uniref:Uncharacterized protein n=1 Tax=Falsihalocynthiibacter arcticus TaxID=1579316 RepID=A0A126V109_9RHOB|nr:hypothetical protein [Falsihalocynthiibacter arcticus]AML51837.1 hypothetical protein RC74_11690 [Falsihalocynthiibacter arcticus]
MRLIGCSPNKHAVIRRTKLADRKAREDKAAELADKEASIAHREAELTEAVEAMSEVFEAVEIGEAVVENGQFFLSRWPDIIARMRGDGRDDVSAPVRKLINGFVGLVVRLTKWGQDSDGPEVQEDDGPSFGRYPLIRTPLRPVLDETHFQLEGLTNSLPCHEPRVRLSVSWLKTDPSTPRGRSISVADDFEHGILAS